MELINSIIIRIYSVCGDVSFPSQNPQADLQAQDRCHRIGQTKPVVVYRLVTANTIDQKILERASVKRKLEQMVIHKSEWLHLRGIPTCTRLPPPPGLSMHCSSALLIFFYNTNQFDVTFELPALDHLWSESWYNVDF